VAIDIAGNAGTTAKIIGAVFGEETLSNKEYVGIGIELLDAGHTYSDVMALALSAKLGSGASNETIVTLLYQNVVGVAPSNAELEFYVGLLENGTYTAASLGVMAADTVLNQANIDLVGLSSIGLEYVP
jgi:hypothetical protein